MDLTILGSTETIRANNVICLARTYRKHAAEMGEPQPEQPTVFLKPNSSLIGDGEAIVIPPVSSEVHHETELAVVIGKRGRGLSKDNAMDHVLGYAILLDITARDIQKQLKAASLPWAYAKGWDTFAPISPITPADRVPDPHDLRIHLEVSGEVRQDSSTRYLTFTIPEIVSFLSSFMTLQPGDVIATGTPEGVGPLRGGDTTVAEIEGLGVLKNRVVKG